MTRHRKTKQLWIIYATGKSRECCERWFFENLFREYDQLAQPLFVHRHPKTARMPFKDYCKQNYGRRYQSILQVNSY